MDQCCFQCKHFLVNINFPTQFNVSANSANHFYESAKQLYRYPVLLYEWLIPQSQPLESDPDPARGILRKRKTDVRAQMKSRVAMPLRIQTVAVQRHHHHGPWSMVHESSQRSVHDPVVSIWRTNRSRTVKSRSPIRNSSKLSSLADDDDDNDVRRPSIHGRSHTGKRVTCNL